MPTNYMVVGQNVKPSLWRAPFWDIPSFIDKRITDRCDCELKPDVGIVLIPNLGVWTSLFC